MGKYCVCSPLVVSPRKALSFAHSAGGSCASTSRLTRSTSAGAATHSISAREAIYAIALAECDRLYELISFIGECLSFWTALIESLNANPIGATSDAPVF
eukprot:4149712-Prymnesium_polylepis.3